MVDSSDFGTGCIAYVVSSKSLKKTKFLKLLPWADSESVAGSCKMYLGGVDIADASCVAAYFHYSASIPISIPIVQ